VEVARFVAVHRYGINAPATVPFRENNLDAFVENLFLFQALGFSSHATSFNSPSWSISVEFYTYFLFAFLVWSTRRLFPIVSFAIFIAGMTLILDGASLGTFGLMTSCATGFFLGTLISVAGKWGFRVPAWSSYIAIVLFFAFLSIRPLGVFDAAIYPLSALLILTLLDQRSGVVRALSLLPFRWLGRISYSLYMSHALVVWGGGMIVAFLIGGHLSEQAVERYAAMPQWVGAVAYLAILTAVLAVAQLTYMIIERPCRNWSRFLVARKLSPAMAPA
jgi:peptidoglycan/LPS O-acetylase OafA/YrhL